MTAEFVDVALAKLAKTLMGAAPAAVPPPPCFDCTLLGDGGIVATHVCDCAGDKPLCGDHVIVHTRRGHDPFPLLPSAAPELAFCETHPNERIKLFCVEDRQAICTVCGPVSHSGHTIVDLGSAPAVLEPQLSAAVDSLASQCSIAADRIVAVLNERDAVRVAADTSEAAAEAAFAALQSAIESHKSRSLRSLLTLRDTREKALTTQSTVLQHGLSQMRDGVALGRHALQSREPSTMTSTLRSLGALARIPTRKYSGPCESRVLSLDVDTSALLDALPLCSTLRQVSSIQGGVFV